MANPQKENGYTAIANEILERIVSSGLNGTELAIVLFVLRKTYGYQKIQDEISISQFEDNLPYTRRTILKAIKVLKLVNILTLVKKGDSRICSNLWAFNKNYDTWKLVSKLTRPKGTSVKTGSQLVSKPIPTKESKESNTIPSKKKTKKVKTKEPKISILLIQELCKHQKMNTPDGSYEYDNIWVAKSLVKKLHSTLQGFNREQNDSETLKLFREIMVNMDDFNFKNATNLKYINNSYQKIINKLK